MATGISTYFDMAPTLWGAEVYPYVALVLGLENILCITRQAFRNNLSMILKNTFRSVVYTPPTLDVSSRIAHGLSQVIWILDFSKLVLSLAVLRGHQIFMFQEGFTLCKYFVLELIFLGLGYLTRISEIQEFCRFAFLGLVVDFYMQVLLHFSI